jgi:hypothetical protein
MSFIIPSQQKFQSPDVKGKFLRSGRPRHGPDNKTDSNYRRLSDVNPQNTGKTSLPEPLTTIKKRVYIIYDPEDRVHGQIRKMAFRTGASLVKGGNPPPLRPLSGPP